MKEELKRRYRSQYIVETLVSVLMGILIMATQYGNIRMWMKPAIELEDLQAEDIRRNNVKVKGVITYVEGAYEYWSGGNSSMAYMEKEFVIFVNGNYIGVFAPYGDWEDKLCNNLNLTNEYFAGNKEAEERLERIEIEGTIRMMAGGLDAYRDYAYSVKDKIGESRQFLPYCLYINEIGYIDKEGIIFFLALGGLFILFGISVSIRYFTGSYLKEINKYCDTTQNPETGRRKIEQLFAKPLKYKDIRISEDLVAIYAPYKVVLLDTQELVWVYQRQWSYSVNLMPVFRTNSIIFWTKEGKNIKVKMKNRKASDEIYMWLRQTHPYFYYGYSLEYKKEYRKNRKTMIQKVEKRKCERREARRMRELGM